MTDPTDRQRAEAKAREFLCKSWRGFSPDEIVEQMADIMSGYRSEGWEAGREAAAKYHDAAAAKLATSLVQYRREGNEQKVKELTLAIDWHRFDATAIRALPTPKEK